jgi:hypothetical protein
MQYHVTIVTQKGDIMRVELLVKGQAKIINIYDLTDFENRGFDISNVNLSQQDEIDNLFDIANELTNSGESQEYQDLFLQLHCVEAENCTFTLKSEEEVTAEVDEVTLKNLSAQKILKSMEQSRNATIFFVKVFSGEAVWDFETETADMPIDPKKLNIGYFDCVQEIDQQESISSSFYDFVCDTLLTDKISYQENKFELVDFVFHSMQTTGTFFIVREDEQSNIKTLETIDFGGKELSDRVWSELRAPNSIE